MKRNFEITRENYMIKVRSRGYVPHWELTAATYFVTVRTADSISAAELDHLKLSGFTPDLRRRAVNAALETWLDQHPERGPLRGQAAQLVADAIQFRHGRQYQLLAWCVMPNHIHLIFRLHPGKTLAQVMHSLKSYTAHLINQRDEKSGPVWEREYFDRIVRPGTLERCIDYVLKNPSKAKLPDWPRAGTAGEPPALPLIGNLAATGLQCPAAE